LTSSYARPAQQGVHYGTDISEKTRVVPTTTASRPAEGCTLSDVVCQTCSATVGQYCREAPTVEQHYLERVYFYKLSRVTLKDSNLEPRDPVFAYGEEDTPEVFGSPVPSVVAPDPKWSHPPPVKSHLRNVYQVDGMMPPPSRSSQTPVTTRVSQAPRSSARSQWPHAQTSRATSSARASSTSSQRRPQHVRAKNPAETTEGLLALRGMLQQNAAFEKMAIVVDNIQREMREIRQATASSNGMFTPVTRTQAEDEELQALRAENQALKKVLKTLPAQTQFEVPQYVHGLSNSAGTPESGSTNALGKRKRDSQVADDSLFFEDDGIVSGYDGFDDTMNERSGLAMLEHDAEHSYSVWHGEDEGSEGDDDSEGNDDQNQDNDLSQSVAEDRPHSETATGERQSARSRERRQTLPADFIAEEQRYLLSDSNDENFNPNDPKVKGRKHKRTRSAERRRRERVERQQDSLWKKGVPGGGYENGDGWVEQKRHHSGRFGRKAAVGDGMAVYPKAINNKLFANGRQIPTTHKRLARELVYLGLEDWIDKDKSDALYRRTIRVARKHYAYHHGGISSKALCQGKYTRKDLEEVGMWDEDLFEEINLGEESDVDNLDFPVDPALKVSLERWKKEGLQAKERKKKAAQEAAAVLDAGENNEPNDHAASDDLDADTTNAAGQGQASDPTRMTEFSDEEGIAQDPVQQPVPEVSDRVEKHKQFDSIWQAPAPTSDNPVLSIIQHAEARIRAAEEQMGEPTFKSRRAQKFKTIDQNAAEFSSIFSRVPSDTYITPANDKAKKGRRKKLPSADTIRNATMASPATNEAVQHQETHDMSADAGSAPTPSDTYIAPASDKAKAPRRRKLPWDDEIRNVTMASPATNEAFQDHEHHDVSTKAGCTPAAKKYRPGGRTSMLTVAEHVALLDLSSEQQQLFLKEVKAYFKVDRDTGLPIKAEQHVAFTDEQLMNFAESFLETNVLLVGGSRKMGLQFWPDDGSTSLSYVADKERIKTHVYDILVVQRFNKARNLKNVLSKKAGENVSISEVLGPFSTRPGQPAGLLPKLPTVSKLANLPMQTKRPFEDGPRLKVKAGFCGNKNYYADGVPKTAEDVARLERRLNQSKQTRKSLPNSLSDEAVLEQDRMRRRTTMLDTSTSNAADSTSMTPPSRDASVLGDTVMQMASAMKQLTKAFDDNIDATDVDLSMLDKNRDIVEEMDHDVVADDSCTISRASTAHKELSSGIEFTSTIDSSVIDEAWATETIVRADNELEANPATNNQSDDAIPINAGSTNEAAQTMIQPEGKGLKGHSARGKPALPALLTRSASKAATSTKLAMQTRDMEHTASQPNVDNSAQYSSSSMSDKENALPELGTGTSSLTEEVEPPAKKVKTTPKRGPGRRPRKSAAELDQLVTETMDRETRSSARKSRSGMYFGSRYSL
jgi:hypothetical protein